MALNTACVLCTSVLKLSVHRVEQRFNTNQFNYEIQQAFPLLHTAGHKEGPCTVTAEEAEKV